MKSGLALAVLATVLAAGCSSGNPSPAASTIPASPIVSSPSPSASPAKATAPTASGGCPAGQDGLLAESAALERSLRVGGARIALATAGIRNRSGDAQADDAIPQWASLTSERPLLYAAAASNGALEGSGAMRLVSGTLAVFPASAFDFRTSRFPDQSSVAARPLVAKDGRLAFAYPTAAGRWVLAFGVTWQTPCLEADGVAYAISITK